VRPGDVGLEGHGGAAVGHRDHGHMLLDQIGRLGVEHVALGLVGELGSL
jgi:hypothetical protein